MTIPFHELSKSAQQYTRDPLERGFVVMARRAGRGHQIKLAFGAIERAELESAGYQQVAPPTPPQEQPT